MIHQDPHLGKLWYQCLGPLGPPFHLSVIADDDGQVKADALADGEGSSGAAAIGLAKASSTVTEAAQVWL